MAAARTKKIKFVKSAYGSHRLAYTLGSVVELPVSQAKDLIENGYAKGVGNKRDKE